MVRSGYGRGCPTGKFWKLILCLLVKSGKFQNFIPSHLRKRMERSAQNKILFQLLLFFTCDCVTDTQMSQAYI